MSTTIATSTAPPAAVDSFVAFAVSSPINLARESDKVELLGRDE